MTLSYTQGTWRVVLCLLAVFSATSAEVDRVCHTGGCNILSVQQGAVHFTDPSRTLTIGKYTETDQSLVPRSEAPIRSLISPRGRLVVISSFLEHSGENEGTARLQIRIYGRNRRLLGTDTAFMMLEQAEIARLFGGDDELLVVQSNEEHSYNSVTDIWYLPDHAAPKQLLHANATFGGLSKRKATPGIWINRQTYDGEHAETKGW